MALNNLGLGFLFTARDLASGVMNRVRGNFNKTATVTTKGANSMKVAMAGTALGLGVVSVGLGTLAVAFGAANQFAKFEQGLAAVKAVTKATTEEVNLLRDAAVQAGIDTQFSPDEATEGLLSLATAGQTAAQATKSLIPVLDLAAGSLGQLGVGEAAESVVGTLNAYGLSADNAADVTDRLLKITQLTNFQTRDFSTGLAKAAAAGSTFNQDLNDVLITMGLLRNRNIDASSSATAFREVTRRLGSDQRAQAAVTGQNVDIFDKQTGKMRSVIDITTELVDATKDMTDEERNRIVVQGFGARGLLAFNAIQKAMFTTTVDGKKVTLEGAAAIEAMRKEMSETTGTAASFRDALLDTFEGQKTLLKGTLQTLAIVGGEAFAKTFKPVISLITDSLNKLILIIKNTPAPVKQVFAGLVLLFGAFATGGGMIALFSGAVALLLPFMGTMVTVFGAVLLAMLPIVLAVGAVTLAVIGFKTALEEIPQAFGAGATLMERFRLGFEALKQLFTQGGFSGAVREELGKKSNEGLRNFVISVFLFVNRIKNFFKGLVEGFRETIGEMGPVFDEMFEAFNRVGEALGFLGEKADADDAKGKFDEMGQTGANIGKMIAKAFGLIVKVITFAADAVVFAIEKWRDFKSGVKSVRDFIVEWMPQLRLLGIVIGIVMVLHVKALVLAMLPLNASLAAVAIKAIFTGASFLVTASGVLTASRSFAALKATLTPFIFIALKVFAVLALVWGIIQAVRDALSDNVDATGVWENAWKRTAVAILGFIKGIAQAFDLVFSALGIDFFADAAKDIEEFKEIVGLTKEGTAIEVQTASPAGRSTAAVSPITGGFSTRRDGPAAPEASIEQTRAAIAGSAGASKEFAEAIQQLKATKEAPTNIRTILMLENETLATAIAKVQRGESAIGFSPGGTPAEA